MRGGEVVGHRCWNEYSLHCLERKCPGLSGRGFWEFVFTLIEEWGIGIEPGLGVWAAMV
jgi:hypothetical protein